MIAFLVFPAYSLIKKLLSELVRFAYFPPYFDQLWASKRSNLPPTYGLCVRQHSGLVFERVARQQWSILWVKEAS